MLALWHLQFITLPEKARPAKLESTITSKITQKLDQRKVSSATDMP